MFRRLLLALALLGAGCARTPLPAPASDAPATVDVIAVGHGDAILITTSAKKSVLIDGGEAEAADRVLAVLRRRSACPLDLILLSHRHADHLGGLANVVEACGARLFMDGGAEHPSAQYRNLLRAIEERHVGYRKATAGRTIDLGAGAALTLLGPPDPLISAGGAEVNANSVVARLAIGQSSMLFMGDADEHTEAWLLGGEARVRSTVLKLGHHGSRTSTSPAFLAAVAPSMAVVSCRNQDSKHPHPETLQRLKKAGTPLASTAEDGTITFGLHPQRVHVSSQSHPERKWLP